MKLMTQKLRNEFPLLYETSDKDPKDVRIIAKFFCTWSNWTWFATEFDGKDTFFGYVRGFENELGYFSLAELGSIEGPFGLTIERDLHFGKHTLAEIMNQDTI